MGCLGEALKDYFELRLLVPDNFPQVARMDESRIARVWLWKFLPQEVDTEESPRFP